MVIPDLPKELIKVATKLPPFPAVAKKLVFLCNDQNEHIQNISAVLKSDCVLSAKAMKIANSPFYGLSQKVSSPNEAVMLLGVAPIGSMAATSLIRCLVLNLQKTDVLNPESFFEHSLRTACAAREIAYGYKIGPEVGFCAGLLHDIGTLLIVLSEHYSKEVIDVSKHEKLVHGLINPGDHAKVGSALASLWGFPLLLQEAILLQHNMVKPPLAELISDACEIAENMGYNNPGNYRLDLIENKQFETEELKTLIIKAEEKFQTFYSLIRS